MEGNAGALIDVAALTRRLTRNEEDAYREFYSAYFDRLWRYLLVVASGNEQAARDALQATFLRVVKSIKVFTDEPSFWSWLTVLARCALFDQTKSQRRYFTFLERFARTRLDDDRSLDAAVSLDQEGDLGAVLRQQLALLSAEDRQLLEWKYFEGYTVQAIAARLSLSEKAVDSRLVRLRQKLKHAVLTTLRNEPKP